MSPGNADWSSSDPDQWPSEDDLARDRLGPRGVPQDADPTRMTPARDKKTPKGDSAPEHTA